MKKNTIIKNYDIIDYNYILLYTEIKNIFIVRCKIMKNKKNNKKKRITTFLSIVLVLAIISVIQFTTFPLSSGFILASHITEEPKLLAHRGFSAIYPENTLPAIEGAVEYDFYGCEFDIHTTKDGIWVLNHDTDIDKMTNGTGEIADMTYNELLKYNVDNGNGIKNYSSLKLPLLEDVLKVIAKDDIVPYIEIKGYDPSAFSDLLELIDKYGLSERAVIISFDMEAVLGIRELDKDIQLMYTTNVLTKEDVDICIANGNIGVDINGGLIFKMADAVKYAQENGLECGAWTIDIPLLADILYAYGVNVFTTNRITP